MANNEFNVLVTGGAGYIGSHVVKMLGERGYYPIVVDNLSTGNADAVLYGELIEADLADTKGINRIIQRYRPQIIMHLAASIRVDESITDPLKYYNNNTINTLKLLQILIQENVKLFLFSSTAAVYGMPNGTVDESTPLNPINPYGESKVMCEHLLEDITRAKLDFRYISLRYFNVAGADEDGRIGQNYPEATHLITRALKTAKGEYDHLDIYGTDYDTRDGTCIRDYIHVNDIAEAHLYAINSLRFRPTSAIYNCGYGHGYTVKEVIKCVKQITGADFEVHEVDRREGDPPVLVANSEAIKHELSWQPQHANLKYIIETAWNWEKKL